MEKQKFKEQLDRATKSVVQFTEGFCFNEFANHYKYIITPNRREGGAHLNDDELNTLSNWNKHENKILTEDEAIHLLHHNNTVPMWIDISVYESWTDTTVIDLLCSRRLREEKELMHQGLHPFHLIVAMPPDSLKNEKNGKFNVNWRINLMKK